MENLIAEKSFAFAIRIVKLYKHLIKDHKEFIIAKQILRSGTSIGANVEEALGGSSRKDFIAKLGISYKETRETKYWLKLLLAAEYMQKETFESLFADADELGKILFKIIKSSRNKNH